MPIDVQQSIRRLGPMILGCIASSVEKTDILPVGVKKRMMINPMTEVPTSLHSVRHHQLAPLPGRIIRIPQPDRNAIPQCQIFYTTLSRQDIKAREKQSNFIQITLSRYEGSSSKGGPMKLKKRMDN